MERQEEYEIRKAVSDSFRHDVNTQLDGYFKHTKGSFVDLILKPLVLVEKRYRDLSVMGMSEGEGFMELIVLGNPLREAVYWFIKEMLLRKKKVKFENSFLTESSDLEKQEQEYILLLHVYYKRAKQLLLMRGYGKVKLQEESDEITVHFPRINEKVKKEMLYFYGLDDVSQTSEEYDVILSCENYLVKKFSVQKLCMNPKNLGIYLNRLDGMKRKIDIEYYDLCKKKVAIDINKIGSQVTSEVIESKDELIAVIAIFYYLSRLCMQKYTIKSGTYRECIEYFCHITKSQLINLASQVNIKKERILAYMKYFTLDVYGKNESNFVEFPLIVLSEDIIWIPSSFVLNDFQFSIVNGHYYKNIKFHNKDVTVSQSIVDYIVNQADKFSNILSNSNYLYFVPGIKFNGKDLKSDIDVSLYDRTNNVLFVIECKWKENVYGNEDDYVHIQDAVKKIFDRQLDKHKFYLEQDVKNINEIFDNVIDFEDKIATMRTLYLYVDKRIQYHENELGRHAITIFMLAYFFNNHCTDKILDLGAVADEIEAQIDKIEYERVKLDEPMNIGSKVIK